MWVSVTKSEGASRVGFRENNWSKMGVDDSVSVMKLTSLIYEYGEGDNVGEMKVANEG